MGRRSSTRYHQASFGTLLLQEARLLHRSKPERSTDTPLADISATLDDGYSIEANEPTEDDADKDNVDDNNSDTVSELEAEDVPMFRSAQFEEARDFQNHIRDLT